MTVIETILKQIGAKTLVNFDMKFVAVDVNTLRLYKGNKQLDIYYDFGADLYDCTKTEIKKSGTEKQKSTGLFNDQLTEIVFNFFSTINGESCKRCNGSGFEMQGAFKTAKVVVCELCGGN